MSYHHGPPVNGPHISSGMESTRLLARPQPPPQPQHQQQQQQHSHQQQQVYHQHQQHLQHPQQHHQHHQPSMPNQQQQHRGHSLHHQTQIPISPSMPSQQQQWAGGPPTTQTQHNQPLQQQPLQQQQPPQPPIPPQQQQIPQAQLSSQQQSQNHHHSSGQGAPPHPQHHQQQRQGPPQHQHQQQQRTQQQQQQPPPPLTHHMNHPQGPPQHPQGQIIMNQQYNFAPMYGPPQMGSFVAAQPRHVAPPYDQHHTTIAASHQQQQPQPDPVNINSQTQQQQPVSINNHYPNNMPLTPMQAQSVISTSTTGTTNVHHHHHQQQPPPLQQQQPNHHQQQSHHHHHQPHHQLNNGAPMMDPSRLPVNQFMMQHPYPFGAIPIPAGYGMPFFGGHPMPQPSPGMIPAHLRVETMNIRQQYDPQNQQTTPLPAGSAPISHTPGVKPSVTTPQAPPNLATTTNAPTPMKAKREKKALPIVHPDTKHVFTVDELIGSPTTTTQSQMLNDSGAPEKRISPKDPSTSDIDSKTDDVIIVNSKSTTGGDTVSSDIPSEEPQTQGQPPPQQQTTLQAPLLQPKIVSASAITTTILTTTSAPEVTKVIQQAAQLTTDTVKLNNSNDQQLNAKSQISPLVTPLKQRQSSDDDDNIPKVTIEERISPEENGKTESNEDLFDEKNLTAGMNSMTISANDKCDLTEKDDGQTPMKKQTLLNLPYAPGQYSPLNKDGNKKYSIDFLRAVAKGMNYDFDIASAQNHKIDFSPHFMNQAPGSGNYRDYSNSPLVRRSSQQMINKPRKIIATTHSLQQEVELKTAEKPWKPELEVEKTKIVEGNEMDTKRLLKVFRGHLNKLTPQKYDSLIEKIMGLDLAGPERLNSVIDLVFDKAVDEPGFCELYARMCKVIAAKDSQFCFHLVKKCQDEFETSDLYDGLKVEDRKAEIELETDSAKKKMMSEELYEDMRIRRKKYLGTIKLIGEMYKLGLLLPKIIGLCMTHLIEEASNENIECLCSLISTVGSKMASEPEEAIKMSLKHTLGILQELTHSKRADEFTLESRIKFKIQDTIDLSRRNWRPRMVENNPRTIDKIREEHHNHNQSQTAKNLLKQDDRDRNRRQGGQLYNTYSKPGQKW